MRTCCTRIARIGSLWVALVIAILAPTIETRPATAQSGTDVTPATIEGDAAESLALFHPWPMFHRNARHTGRAWVVGPQTAALRWAAPVGAIGGSSPAIARDGTIYVGSYGLTSSGLLAVNPDGTVKWHYPVHAGIMTSSPAIAPDGTVYVGTNAGTVIALNPDGTLKWLFPFLFAVSSSPTIGPDGTIYVGDSGGCVLGVCVPSYLFAFNSDGTVRWQYLMSDRVGPSAAIGWDGTIYIGDGSALLALTPEGTLRWRVPTIGPISTAPAIGWRGTVYIGTANNYVQAIAPDGRRLWSRLVGPCNRFFCGITGSPAIAIDGSVVVGDAQGYVTVLGVLGTFRWQRLTGGCRPFGPPFPMTRICSVDSAVAIGGDGTIYVASNAIDTTGAPVLRAYVNAFSAAGRLKWRLETAVCDLGCAIQSSAAIGDDGTVYLGSTNGVLYAFGPGPV